MIRVLTKTLYSVLFQASKVEEFGVISNTRLINTCANIVKNKFSYAYPNQDFPYRPNHILECEFYLLENMDCCLVSPCPILGVR